MSDQQQWANILGSPVLDKTGLKGFYDFKLEWTPDGSQMRTSGDDGSNLEKKKGPGEVLVVDHAERASEN